MSQQARIDALEHLLIAVLKLSKITLVVDTAFENAHSSIMGSDGPGGPAEKTKAVEYLNYLKSQLK
ncbi:hypothetical protein [Azotobacter salinestris]|uniref:hypothetical protein n=1 Tax=Azotobacter salinestris TaxID=69964 RepID=UPI0032DF5F79